MGKKESVHVCELYSKCDKKVVNTRAMDGKGAVYEQTEEDGFTDLFGEEFSPVIWDSRNRLPEEDSKSKIISTSKKDCRKDYKDELITPCFTWTMCCCPFGYKFVPNEDNAENDKSGKCQIIKPGPISPVTPLSGQPADAGGGSNSLETDIGVH